MYIMSVSTEEGIYKLVSPKVQIVKSIRRRLVNKRSKAICCGGSIPPSGQEVPFQGPVDVRRPIPVLQEGAREGGGRRGRR